MLKYGKTENEQKNSRTDHDTQRNLQKLSGKFTFSIFCLTLARRKAAKLSHIPQPVSNVLLIKVTLKSGISLYG